MFSIRRPTNAAGIYGCVGGRRLCCEGHGMRLCMHALGSDAHRGSHAPGFVPVKNKRTVAKNPLQKHQHPVRNSPKRRSHLCAASRQRPQQCLKQGPCIAWALCIATYRPCRSNETWQNTSSAALEVEADTETQKSFAQLTESCKHTIHWKRLRAIIQGKTHILLERLAANPWVPRTPIVCRLKAFDLCKRNGGNTSATVHART